jgi:hypothetical protein
MASFTYAFYKGLDMDAPIRDSGGQQGSSPFTTGSLFALTDDSIVAALAATDNTSVSWTNATQIATTTFSCNNTHYAENAPSGDTTVTATINAGDGDGALMAVVLAAAPALASVTTQNPTQTAEQKTSLVATLNGTITIAGSGVDDAGFVYDTVSHTDPGNVAAALSGYASFASTTDSFSVGAFSKNVSITNTTYYIRAFAHTANGYSYGNEVAYRLGRRALLKPPNNLGLVGYWSFNEATGTVATDFSGNGNAGTLSTTGSILPVWASGKRGQALDFDGDQSYVSVQSSTSLNPTTAVTVAAWVRADSWAGNPRIVSKGSSGANLQYELFVNSGLLSWGVGANHSLSSFDVALPSTGAWHNIVGVYSASISAIYIDGALIFSEDPSDPPINTSSDPLHIGTLNACDFSIDCFDGKIDEVRIYSRALGASEIAKLYESGAVKVGASSADLDDGSTLEQGLVAHYTLDGKDTAETITDRSGNGNHGYFFDGATSSAKVIGKLGQALRFDGDNDTVWSADVVPHAGDAFTMAFWMKDEGSVEVDPVMAWRHVVWCQRTGVGGNFEIACHAEGEGAGLQSTTEVFLDDEWHHIVFALTSGARELYVDGVLEDSDTESFGFDAPTDMYLILAGRAFSSSNFKGVIDDARLYNRKLTAPEAKQLYNMGTVRITQ